MFSEIIKMIPVICLAVLLPEGKSESSSHWDKYEHNYFNSVDFDTFDTFNRHILTLSLSSSL